MSTNAAPAKENSAENSAPNLPLIRGYTPQGRQQAEVTLWMNPNASEENAKAPDLTGHVIIDGQKTAVSAWLRPAGTSEAGKEHGAFLSLASRIKNDDGTYGGESIGNLNAMNSYQGQEVDGSKGLKVIGTLKVSGKEVVVTGYMNGRYEKDELLECARQLGFSEKAVAGFEKSLEQDNKKAARPSA